MVAGGRLLAPPYLPGHGVDACSKLRNVFDRAAACGTTTVVLNGLSHTLLDVSFTGHIPGRLARIACRSIPARVEEERERIPIGGRPRQTNEAPPPSR